MDHIKLALEEKQKNWMRSAAAGLGAGAATYGLLRKGKTKGLNPFQQHARKHGLAHVIDKKEPATRMGKMMDRIRFGGDKIYYGQADKNIPLKPKKAKEALVFQQDYSPEFVRSKQEMGLSRVGESKRKEMKVIEKLGPEATAKNVFTGAKHKGQPGLQKLHKSMKGKNYFIKPDEGFASGVGGTGFVNSKDVSTYLAGGKVDKKKGRMIRDFMRNPTDYIAQKDMNLAKDKLTGATQEFRVHAAGDKVIRGASSPRSKNILGKPGDKRKAEKFLQEHLKKLPKKHQQSMMAADVAKTKDGKFKIIELNMGSNASGLLDPDFIKKKHGTLPSWEAVRKNQAMYKGLTGRASQLEAATKGLGVSGLAVGGAQAAQDRGAKKKERR